MHPPRSCSQASPAANAATKNPYPRALTADEDDPDLPPREAPPGILGLLHDRNRAGAAERLPVIRANLRLLPPPAAPAPSPAIDAGLRALGLLGFVRLDLSRSSSSGGLRSDLVAALIANYLPTHEWSYAGGAGFEVSRGTFAAALCLPPPRMTASVDHEPPAGVDRAAVTSAATEFMNAYIMTPLAAANKGKLPAYVESAARRVKDGMAHTVDWTSLLWRLVEEEVFELRKGKRTDWKCYYGAYLKRLIWMKWPHLFWSPPVAPSEQAALVDNNHQLRSELESKMQEYQVRSELLEARSIEVEAKSRQLDALAERHHHEMRNLEQDNKMLQDEVQTVKLLNQTLLSKETESKDKLQRGQQEMTDVRKQLAHLQEINQVMAAKRKKDNDELQRVQNKLAHVSKQLEDSQEEMYILDSVNKAILVAKERESNDEREALEFDNKVLTTKEIRSKRELQCARKALIDGLQNFTKGKAHIGVKRMGDLDLKEFAKACKQDLLQEDARVDSVGSLQDHISISLSHK